MKVSLEHHGIKVSVEFPRDDLTTPEVAYLCEVLLIGAGFDRDSVTGHIVDTEIPRGDD